MSPLPRWNRGPRQELVKTRIFDLVQRRCASPTRPERAHDFYIVETPDWVNVIPLLDDETVVMVRQYRHGRDEITLEVPGGMVDPEDPGPLEAGRRELWEETGYHAGSLRAIGKIAPNPAIQSNLCHSYIATGLELKPGPACDSTEELEVVTVPLAEVPDLIRRGEITHSLVVVAFWHMFHP